MHQYTTTVPRQHQLKHNKKRNVGLLYEFFARYIGKAILDSNDSDIVKSKVLLRKHFNKSTDIYKELRLFKALSEARVSSRDQAVHLINRVREAVKTQSQARLDMEKTSLIREVSETLNAERFFSENIQDYKRLATIQCLLNTWRDEALKESVSETVFLEERLIESMMVGSGANIDGKHSTALMSSDTAMSMTTEDVDKLVVNIMTEKVNERYADLSREQKDLIRLYVFSQNSDATANNSELSNKLQEIRERVNANIKRRSYEFSEDKTLTGKLDEVKSLISSPDAEYYDTSSVNDEKIGFYLGLLKLNEEITAPSHNTRQRNNRQ